MGIKFVSFFVIFPGEIPIVLSMSLQIYLGILTSSRGIKEYLWDSI